MKGRVDQILAGFAFGDAISNEARILRGILREWGLESDIFADTKHISPEASSECKPLADYRGAASDAVIHHYSIGSPAVDVFLASKATRVLMYHNITPAEFFVGFDDGVTAQLRDARSRLESVLPVVDRIWAVSEFNAQELKRMGAKKVSVFPLVFAPELLDLPADPDVFKKLSVDLRNILFVGRLVPHKKVENLIMAFAWYHRVINRQRKLLIVVSERSAPRYYLMLRMLANELDLPNVCFERFASEKGLPAYYELADVFVTASEHEGYCLPLVEAMHKGVPVIAHRTGGIPEALGNAGIMYDDASPIELAELINRVIADAPLRNTVLESQKLRMNEMRKRNVGEELKALLSEVS